METSYQSLFDRPIKKSSLQQIVLFAMFSLICISVVGMNVFLGLLYTELGHLHTSIDVFSSLGYINKTDIANALKCIGGMLNQMCHA